MLQRLALFLILTSQPVFAGCARSVDDPSDPAVVHTTVDQLTLTVYLTIYDDSDETEGTKTQTFDDPTPEVIREQFQALDWTNPRHSCGMTLSRGVVTSPEVVSLAISGTLGAADLDKSMRAIWSERANGSAAWKHHVYQPIDKSELAMDLLLSFLAQDDRYRSLVEWKSNT